jgi:hypothetical protein
MDVQGRLQRMNELVALPSRIHCPSVQLVSNLKIHLGVVSRRELDVTDIPLVSRVTTESALLLNHQHASVGIHLEEGLLFSDRASEDSCELHVWLGAPVIALATLPVTAQLVFAVRMDRDPAPIANPPVLENPVIANDTLLDTQWRGDQVMASH